MNDINKEADINILVHFEKNLQDQEKEILANLGEALQNHKLDAVICVAGGFESGNTEEDLVAKADLMWKQNVWPSLITASIATKYLKPNGFVCLPGIKKILLNETLLFSTLNFLPTTISFELIFKEQKQQEKELLI